ncbi:MAG: DUF928 domain-containing protein [Scytolyngbya sp. HA4215-MV1]|jgi:hypothetical protein|nr:DUF928 domain-containing protein [Scytolyngbya sp. HA4215-MV1]
MYQSKSFATSVIGYFPLLVCLLTMSLPSSVLATSVIPPVDGAPGGRSPGGSRDPDCLSQKSSIVALVPASAVGGLTTKASPTFFVYVPTTHARTAEFALRNENKKTIYKSIVKLSGKSEVIGIRLPATSVAPKLEMGKRYRWFFSVVCDANAPDKSGNPFVQGWIQRAQPSVSLSGQLSQASSRDRAQLYKQAGFWYEAVGTLAELRRSRPSDPALKADWSNLLRSVGLDQAAAEPIAQY